MTTYDFVLNMFNACREEAKPINLETAEADLENFRQESIAAPDCWDIPEDITAEEYMRLWNELCIPDEIKSLAEEIRTADEWDQEKCKELCKAAGLADEWEQADGESFESVLYKAADLLGVEII